jgi:hypothetical protein
MGNGAPSNADPVVAADVDRTLLRQNLRLTPEDRILPAES